MLPEASVLCLPRIQYLISLLEGIPFEKEERTDVDATSVKISQLSIR